MGFYVINPGDGKDVITTNSYSEALSEFKTAYLQDPLARLFCWSGSRLTVKGIDGVWSEAYAPNVQNKVLDTFRAKCPDFMI